MEGLHLLSDLIQQGDWMIKMDLKDAYLQVPILEAHQCFLQFAWEGKHYKFQCLQFGLSSAPRVFTKLLKPADNLLGRHAFYACKQGTTRAHGTIDSESLRGLGPYGEQSEFTSNTHTTYRILGISNQFMQSTALLTPGKGKENLTGSVQAPPKSYSISQGNGNIYREGLMISATSRAL